MKSPEKSENIRIIVLAGLIAGTVDIGAASVIHQTTPVVIAQAIAQGLLGRISFAEGLSSAGLGVVVQWGMSVVIASLCFAGNRRIAYLGNHWVRSGLIYGAITYCVMSYLVVPLSRVAQIPTFSIRLVVENLLAMFLFGLIITFLTRRRGRVAEV